MQPLFIQYRLLFIRIGILILIYSLCRLLFALFNPEIVTKGFFSTIPLFFYGLRFDLFSILIVNALFILLHILPFRFFFNKSYQQMLKWVFVIGNIPGILFNCIDFIYFHFTKRRTTADFFRPEVMNDVQGNVIKYVTDFWYVFLIFIGLVYLAAVLYNLTLKNFKKPFVPINYWKGTLLAVLSVGLYIIGARGGTQFKPIGMQTAARYAQPQQIALVLNTPFTIIKTRNLEELPDEKYFDEKTAQSLAGIYHHYYSDTTIRKLNVVIIIMESFSKEYIGYFNNGKGYTPFFDSLCKQSFTCTNAVANAKRSIEGIPAIVASLPQLMEEPFITSAYNTNAVNSIASILKKEGYSTSFFHGGNNGTMGFENFSVLAGYDKYYGRNQYTGSNADYDGHWGIFDEPFLNFFADELGKNQQPFCATVFTLSSHHPYAIPSKYKNTFERGTIPIHESVGYADYSLKTFFEKAKKQAWFNNTLFVITSDHTGPGEKPFYQSSKGIYDIPVLYYCPSDSLLGIYPNVTQQCDIVPSILDYLKYSGSFTAFGNSIFSDDKNKYAINYTNNIYQLFDDNYLLQFDGASAVALYNYTSDSLLQDNLLGKMNVAVQKEMELKIKSVVQQYRQAMIHNTIVLR